MAIPLLAITIKPPYDKTQITIKCMEQTGGPNMYTTVIGHFEVVTLGQCSVKLPSRNSLGRLLHWQLPYCQETGLKFVPQTTTDSQNLSIQTLSEGAIESGVHSKRVELR